MKRRRKPKQDLAKIIKKHPDNDSTCKKLPYPDQPVKFKRPGERPAVYFAKTRSAEDTVFVFGNTFPAEIASALRTPSHSFSLPVIITSLMNQVLHKLVYPLLEIIRPDKPRITELHIKKIKTPIIMGLSNGDICDMALINSH